MRDLGSPVDINAILKQAVNCNVIIGPRIITCNKAISITGGHFHYAGGREADGGADMAKAVREQIKSGAECIKVMLTGCVKFETMAAGYQELSSQEFQILMEEANRLKRPVAVHVNGIDAVKQAICMGAWTIEHAALLNRAVIEQLAKSSTFWTPTLIAFRRMLDYSREHFSRSLPQAGIKTVYENHCEMVRLGIKMGAKIIAGTDAGSLGVEHGDLHEEIVLLSQLGMPCVQAINAATGLAAAALGIGDSVGTIACGKKADFIILKGDPRLDITCLKNIIKVYKGGKGGSIAALVFPRMSNKDRPFWDGLCVVYYGRGATSLILKFL